VSGQAAERARPAPAPGYRPETLDVLFGNREAYSAILIDG